MNTQIKTIQDITKIYPENLTLGSLFFDQVEKYQNKEFVTFWKNAKLCKLSWLDFSGVVNSFIVLLKEQKVTKGDLIAIYARNSPEYLALLIACSSIGALCCPIHTTINKNQAIKLINDYQYKLFFCSDTSKFNNKNLPTSILKLSTKKKCTYVHPIETIKNTIKPDDTAYIMLSSGTTGVQKGIILTHKNILINHYQVQTELNMITSDDYYLSFLPFSHSYGGLAEIYQVIFHGAKYHFCKNTDLKSILEELQDIQPSIFQTIPRTWEKLYKYFLSFNNIDQNFISEKTGSRMKFGFSAGARLSTDIVQFFLHYNLPIYQGYGLTEASPSLAIASPENIITHNCAKILPFVNIKFSINNEIMASGPNISPGYYKATEETKKTFIDGYINTGDLGEKPKDGYIRMFDRFKNLIVLSTGKKVLPDKIEKSLNENKLINYSILIGTQKPYISAIFILDKKECLSYTGTNTTKLLSDNQLIEHKLIKKEIEAFIKEKNTELAEEAQIKKFFLSFEKPLNEELTPTNKIIRSIFEKNKSEIIEYLYSS